MTASRPLPATLVDWVAANAVARPGAMALRQGEQQWSYGRLWDRAGRTARALVSEPGFRPGSRVGLLGANSPDFLAAYFGVLRAGGAVVPLNGLLSQRELAAQLALVGAAGCIVAPGAPYSGDDIGAARSWSTDDLDSPEPGTLPRPDPMTPASILLTSGSTGAPKGVVHSHGTLLHAALQMAMAMPYDASDVSVAFLPFFASIPEQVLPALVSGGALDVVPRFDVEAVAASCRRATSMDAVPTVMARLLDEGALEAVRGLRWVMFASEPMPPALLQRWWDAAPGVQTYQFYGMTEMLTITHASDAMLRADPATVGRPFPTSRVEVVDPAGVAVTDLVDGEVTCASPARMLDYHQDPSSTAAVLTDQGALRTGDLARIDERGLVFLTGRLKDVIISGGLNVSPAEIEAVACRHPQVAMAAVVGIPDARWGETPVVVAVPLPGNDLTAAEVLRHCRSELVGFKRPSAAALVESLPLTGIGKSAKAELRRRLLAGTIEVVDAG
jgi:acyl-CoA synthetase (AMP-forming)/AMP-acid ligase II